MIKEKIKEVNYSKQKGEVILSKANISIDKKLLNKYKNVKEIFIGEKNNYNGVVNVSSDISTIINKYDLTRIEDVKRAAIEIFFTYHSKSVFMNDNNKIIVNRSGINESVEKIFNNRRQRNLLIEHLKIFSDLGDIIEHARLVNQAYNVKKKNKPDVISRNYYFDGVKIGTFEYIFEFEVRTMQDGENQYRVQRLEQKKAIRYDGDLII